jgi:hypothetical protein
METIQATKNQKLLLTIPFIALLRGVCRTEGSAF